MCVSKGMKKETFLRIKLISHLTVFSSLCQNTYITDKFALVTDAEVRLKLLK